MCSVSANETNTNNSMKWVMGMQFTRENRVLMRWDAGGFAVQREWGCVGALLGRSAADRVSSYASTHESGSIRQLSPVVTAIKNSALLPRAILTSKSGERLDRPQPGLTKLSQTIHNGLAFYSGETSVTACRCNALQGVWHQINTNSKSTTFMTDLKSECEMLLK